MSSPSVTERKFRKTITTSKMAAKSKRRLSKIETKLLKLDKLEVKDVICSICQSILIEPVTLPCHHNFCQRCFNGSIENNALCCPLCRLRIGSWVRTATKQKNLVNIKLWNFIKEKFSAEIDKKIKGEDVELSPEPTITRLSEPGEIRSEYEAELKRLRAERVRLEQKHFQETEMLIEKLHKEEEEAHKKYLENIKQDEILAVQMQQESQINTNTSGNFKSTTVKNMSTKPRLKPTTIDSYLSKPDQATISKRSPILTLDNTCTKETNPITTSHKSNSRLSPEMLPNYGKLLKNFLDKKLKTGSAFWNKENGKRRLRDKDDQQTGEKDSDKSDEKCLVKTRNGMQSLLVSLPLPHTGILHHKSSVPENRNIETGSVDSMRQELCYFKPIEGTTPTSFATIKDPLRVPSTRVDKNQTIPPNNPLPSRAQFLDGLCTLRNISLSHKLPSAFVIALSILQTKKEIPKKYGANSRSKGKKNSLTNPWPMTTLGSRRSTCNRNKQETVEGISKLNSDTLLRRTRSMGSIPKDDNEITPKKKAKVRKFNSERKPYLRSGSKQIPIESDSCTPPINNNVNLAVKNLSSPLENCDVKSILCEQLRIEKLIEQEKSDLELALKMDAEWNGRRQLRRTATKRQVTLNYALRPAKKLKV